MRRHRGPIHAAPRLQSWMGVAARRAPPCSAMRRSFRLTSPADSRSASLSGTIISAAGVAQWQSSGVPRCRKKFDPSRPLHQFSRGRDCLFRSSFEYSRAATRLRCAAARREGGEGRRNSSGRAGFVFFRVYLQTNANKRAASQPARTAQRCRFGRFWKGRPLAQPPAGGRSSSRWIARNLSASLGLTAGTATTFAPDSASAGTPA